jgi:hypothetical protein
MSNGKQHAFKLYLELKLEFVQKPSETKLPSSQVVNHEYVTNAINRVLQSGFNDSHQFIDFARCAGR